MFGLSLNPSFAIGRSYRKQTFDREDIYNEILDIPFGNLEGRKRRVGRGVGGFIREESEGSK